jgi:hypothetical protein
MADGQITIPLSEYRTLLKAQVKIKLLRAGGVDNWEWYGEALNPEGEDSYSDLADAIDEKWTG